jgi:glycosyltransferase involved in cell wall biosynthesis
MERLIMPEVCALGPPLPPITFLVSTTPSAGDPEQNLGAAEYSYGFVWRALEPVVRRLGVVELIDRPESRLSFAAMNACRAGRFPVHLAILPPHQAYFPADLPTILVPFWEFPQIPDRSFAFDTRNDWVRTARAARLIVAACEHTAQAFRHAGIGRPVVVIPVPLDPSCFEVAPWNPCATWTCECRHIELGGGDPILEDPVLIAPADRDSRSGWKQALCAAYGQSIRPWMSRKALERARRFRLGVLRIPDRPPPLLPRRRLELSGLIYLSVFNFSDRRKNPRDLLTAFLTTFRERRDVTLVLKLATNPLSERAEVEQLIEMYRSFGLTHLCRVVAITDFLEPDVLRSLHGAAAYYINTSRAEGACLPLQEALAAGRPAVAPTHTAMADYLDADVAFPIRSSAEPAAWPHDPDQRSTTTWARLSWTSLCDCLRESASVAEDDRSRYDRMARAARERMQSQASREVVCAAWREAIVLACSDQTAAA